MNKPHSSEHVVILGAGVAGLAAGWKLSSRGYRVSVVEMGTQVGGLCRTLRRGGFSFDIGGHRFLTSDKSLENEVLELMKGTMKVNTRVSTILMEGKFIRYPLDLVDLVKKMSLPLMVKAFIYYLLSNAKRRVVRSTDRSFEDWVKRRFGRVLYEIYFGVYTEKLWGVNPSTIAADWAAQRISLIDLWDVMYRLIWHRTHKPRTFATEFYYPSQGIGEIAERMAERIRTHEGQILLGTPVLKVRHGGNDTLLVDYLQGDTPKWLEASHVISTIPLPDLTTCLDPSPPEDVVACTERLRFRSIRLLNLSLNMPRVSENTWIYVPEKEYLFFRVQEPRNWSPALCPEGKTSLSLEIACDEGDAIWQMRDEQLVDICLRDLGRLGLPIARDQVIDAFSVKEKHAYPVYALDYKTSLSRLYAYLDRIERLVICGRQGTFRYNNMDHSIKMGFLAAEHICGNRPKHLILEVAEEPAAFEYKA